MHDLLGILEELTSSDMLLENIAEVHEEQKKSYYERFTKIYSGDFRHYYSKLSVFLEKQSPDVYASLCLWIEAIVEYAEKNTAKDSVCRSLKKLQDHIELESIRLERMKEVKRYALETSEMSQEIRRTADQAMGTSQMAVKAADLAKKNAHSAKKNADDAKENLETYHEKSIAILSIFSAVILAFMGGVSFSSGVLESISKASMFRLLITVLLLGFVLFNSVFVLMRFIAYIVYKKDPVGFKNGIIGFNATLAIIAVLILAGYACGWGETIEKWGQISSETTSSTSAEIINNSSSETT